MPSPFPGMDPYLEDPALWPGFHQLFIGRVLTALNAVLPQKYVANISERFALAEPEEPVNPEVAVLEMPSPASPAASPAELSSGPVAPDTPWIISSEPGEAQEPFLEILQVGDEQRVIAIVEVLTPRAKAAGSRARQRYRARQRQVLSSPTHLLEIDLLREGEHTVAVPRDRLIRRGAYDYLAALSRGGKRNVCEVWPISLRQRLPRVALPLAEGDPDVVLDLQVLFTRCYDAGGFGRRIDYSRRPAEPLLEADADWADDLLSERGLRA